MEIILLIVFGSVFVGFGLIFLLALAEKQKKSKMPESHKSLDQSQFEKACVQILEAMKLELDEFHRSASNQLDIIARNPTPISGGTFLAQCLYVPDDYIIDTTPILELSNMVTQDRLSKGILMTPGNFASDLSSLDKLGELAPLELIGGEKFRALVKEHAPDYWVILS